ncbi:hypothetical protein [Embleya sp. NPDC005575]|uniref:hypothetical protein n=1 Tax=Embleya sp. NPDC005575 TaxID=3156892 RepID=UPI0033B801AC
MSVMRKTRIIAILTSAALASGAGTAVAIGEAGTSPAAAGAHVASPAQPAALSMEAATKQIEQLGSMGALAKASADLLAAAQPQEGTVADTSKVKEHLTAVQNAGKDLLAKAPTDKTSTSATSAAPSATMTQAVSTVVSNAEALAAAITSPDSKPVTPPAAKGSSDVPDIANLVNALAKSLLDLIGSLVGTLTGPGGSAI